jgi:hypothetical protein
MSSVYCFSVHSEATPASLPRVLDVFALYGHVPEQCHSQLGGRDHEELVIDVQMSDLTAEAAARVAKRLGRVVTVTGVLYSEKQRCAA